MQNNPYVLSLGATLVVFLLLVVNKKMTNEKIDRIEIGKVAVLCGLVVLIILQVNQSSTSTPVLNEPFISSLES